MKIICLANSYKHNGRCIAGIDGAGRWVRPVSSSQKRAIDKDTRIIDENEPQILDVLEIPLHAHGPVDGCQPENKLLKAGQWKRVGQARAKDLLKYCEDDSVILHNNRDHVPASCFRVIPSYGWKSLQLIHNENVTFEQDKNNKAKWRANFINSKGTGLSLRVTDPAICERLEQGEHITKDCLLTISMAPGWSPDKKTSKNAISLLPAWLNYPNLNQLHKLFCFPGHS
ncbi:MAG: dual OB domain-containing protein [Planctomycetota bacterium]|jgi:hypothetical protein